MDQYKHVSNSFSFFIFGSFFIFCINSFSSYGAGVATAVTVTVGVTVTVSIFISVSNFCSFFSLFFCLISHSVAATTSTAGSVTSALLGQE